MDSASLRGIVLKASEFSLQDTALGFAKASGVIYESSDEDVDVEDGLNTVSLNPQHDFNLATTVSEELPYVPESTSETKSAGPPLLNCSSSLTTQETLASPDERPHSVSTQKDRNGAKRRTGSPEKRQSYSFRRQQSRKEASLQKMKERQATRAAERLTSNTIPSNPSIFAEAKSIQSIMLPESVQRQKPSFLAKYASSDKRAFASKSDSSCQSRPVVTAKPDNVPSSAQLNLKDFPDLHENCDPEVVRLCKDEGYLYVKNVKGEAQLVVDQNNRIFFVKSRAPSNWDEITRNVRDVIYDISRQAYSHIGAKGPQPTSNRHVSPEECLQIILGLTYPMGGLSPQSQNIPEFFRKHTDLLMENKWVIKYINHVTRSLRTWFPRHAFVYEEVMKRLELDQKLRRNIFPGSIFCGTTFNLGPKGVTIRHRDSRNLVGGLCMIGALGHFNHETSGHFIMEEAKVIVELRHGDVAFMPSAGITHQNSQLREGESRASIVQYTSGCLFQWIWQGKKVLSDSDKRLKVDIRAAQGAHRWKELYTLFPTMDEWEVAKKTGLMSLGNVEQVVRSGHSFLFPSY